MRDLRCRHALKRHGRDRIDVDRRTSFEHGRVPWKVSRIMDLGERKIQSVVRRPTRVDVPDRRRRGWEEKEWHL